MCVGSSKQFLINRLELLSASSGEGGVNMDKFIQFISGLTHIETNKQTTIHAHVHTSRQDQKYQFVVFGPSWITWACISVEKL